MATHRGNAQWKGSLTDGGGEVEVAGRKLPYSFHSRFENGDGTSPEALIGSAHAGCLAMALSHELSQAGHTVQQMDVRADVRLNKQGEGFAIDRIRLQVRGKISGIDGETFQEFAEKAKANCPVSKALSAVEHIELDAALAE